MSKVNSKVDFPKSSPDGLINMAETLLDTHSNNPSAVVAMDADKTDAIRNNVALAKQKRADAKAASALSVKLNGEADKILGLAIGQSLEDETTVAGWVTLFQKHSKLAFSKDIEKLRDYGFKVKLSQPKPRAPRAKVDKTAPKK